MSDAPEKKTNVRKIAIVAYKDKELQQAIGKSHQFFVPINPESYSEQFENEYDTRTEGGQQGSVPKYKSSKPQDLKLDFTLDGTNTIEGYAYPDMSVVDQIALLKKVTYDYNGDIHRPNFLKVFWAENLQFPCILATLSINYTLFDADGNPLRAKVSANFKQHLSVEKRDREARANSPDLTHIRQVQAGDRLDLMTYRIYNDSQLFLQIAEANGLTSLRRPPVGQSLRFPPLDKTENT